IANPSVVWGRARDRRRRMRHDSQGVVRRIVRLAQSARQRSRWALVAASYWVRPDGGRRAEQAGGERGNRPQCGGHSLPIGLLELAHTRRNAGLVGSHRAETHIFGTGIVLSHALRWPAHYGVNE